MFLHYFVKHEHEPRKLSFMSCCIPCLENDTALACYIFDTHEPILIIFCRPYGRIIKYSVQVLFLA